jgi:hypothetical protein
MVTYNLKSNLLPVYNVSLQLLLRKLLLINFCYRINKTTISFAALLTRGTLYVYRCFKDVARETIKA